MADPTVGMEKGFRLEAERTNLFRPYEDFLANYSHLYRFTRWQNNTDSWSTDALDDYPDFLYEKGTDSWNQCRTALTKISEAMATKDVPVALVLFPLFFELKNFFKMMNMRGLFYTGNLISLPALKTSMVLAV